MDVGQYAARANCANGTMEESWEGERRVARGSREVTGSALIREKPRKPRARTITDEIIFTRQFHTELSFKNFPLRGRETRAVCLLGGKETTVETIDRVRENMKSITQNINHPSSR